jgi:hypothetical protein
MNFSCFTSEDLSWDDRQLMSLHSLDKIPYLCEKYLLFAAVILSHFLSRFQPLPDFCQRLHSNPFMFLREIFLSEKRYAKKQRASVGFMIVRSRVSGEEGIWHPREWIKSPSCYKSRNSGNQWSNKRRIHCTLSVLTGRETHKSSSEQTWSSRLE